MNQPPASALVPRPGVLEAHAKSSQGIAQNIYIHRLVAGAGKVRSTIGLSGVATLFAGAVLAVGGALWAIHEGVALPVAIMAGYGTMVASVCLCAALLVVQDRTAKVSTTGAKRQPNYAAWKLVSKLSVSDASRLWCDIEPGCPASQESIAWAFAMLDAAKRGELPVSARAGASQVAGHQEQNNPTWHSEIAREALKSWARSHGHSPRFLHG